MLKLNSTDELDKDVIGEIMQEESANQEEKIRVKRDCLNNYIPRDDKLRQAEKYIIKALERDIADTGETRS